MLRPSTQGSPFGSPTGSGRSLEDALPEPRGPIPADQGAGRPPERVTLARIAYVSRRARGLSDREIVDAIVLPSMKRNRRTGITGRIWFDGRSFFQVIEGDGTEIRRLIGAIATDPRHTEMRIVADTIIEEFSFDRFEMRSGLGVASRAPALIVDAIYDPKPKRPIVGTILNDAIGTLD